MSSTSKKEESKEEISHQSISELFGLTPAASHGTRSVLAQLEIWESSMKGYTEQECMIVKIENENMK